MTWKAWLIQLRFFPPPQKDRPQNSESKCLRGGREGGRKERTEGRVDLQRLPITQNKTQTPSCRLQGLSPSHPACLSDARPASSPSSLFCAATLVLLLWADCLRLAPASELVPLMCPLPRMSSSPHLCVHAQLTPSDHSSLPSNTSQIGPPWSPPTLATPVPF